MRVLLDANLLVSYLLHPDRASAVSSVVRAAILGRFCLLVPEGLLLEMCVRVEEKTYLAQRIRREDLEELVAILRETAEMLPAIGEPIPSVVRDPKDDYLAAHAVLGRADYLVTGDRDLLALDPIESARVVTPAEFLRVIDQAAAGA